MPTIVLGVTGGIAAYKTPELVRQLKKSGLGVRCILTRTASQFVTSQTLAVVSENPVTDHTSNSNSPYIQHLQSRHQCDLMVIAPATANFIAKAVAGIADSPLLSEFLAFPGPKLVVPAMHDTMWTNPATQRNLKTLQEWGIEIIGPDVGPLASGDFGPGRMIDIELIVLKTLLILHNTPRLDGIKALVGMGGTREYIDPVRVISNISTGRLGSTLSHAIALQGGHPVVVSTVDISPNPHIDTVHLVSTANEMKEKISIEWVNCDVLIMPAAISDYRPIETSQKKIKRTKNIPLELVGTEDILQSLPKRPHQRTIGFCLESNSTLIQSAHDKRVRKNLDAIIANTPDEFGQPTRSFSILDENGQHDYSEIPLPNVASILIGLIFRLCRGTPPSDQRG